jgi:Ulp1 family protease
MQVNMFDFDLVIFPRNISNVHWTCVVLDMKAHHIYYYDSIKVGFISICILIDLMKYV